MKDNQHDEDKEKCKIYSYREAEKECPNGRSHHIVPDRCWRSPGTRRQNTGRPSFGASIDELLDKFLAHRGGGYYYAGKMDEGKGQCICVTEEEHLAIHAVYDSLEDQYGGNAIPQWTATLEKLEGLGAVSVSAVTRCDESKIRETLRKRHQDLELDKDTLLRADPRGKSGLTMPKFAEVLSRVQQAKLIK
ncbi:hypothetical protein [Massilia genomosp. 1]|nr:hypothetical protein [Massilia genomosp. 1]